MTECHIEVIWTDYLQYRARLRGFDLAMIEHIVRYSGERFIVTVHGFSETSPLKLVRIDVGGLVIAQGRCSLHPWLLLRRNDKPISQEVIYLVEKN